MDQADLYARVNELWKNDTRAVLDKFSPYINWNETDTLLDIGCGPGDVTMDLLVPRMPNDFETVIGMDISRKMIGFAREKFPVDKVMFEPGDIGGDLALLSHYVHKFDLVTSFFCLHFVADQR